MNCDQPRLLLSSRSLIVAQQPLPVFIWLYIYRCPSFCFGPKDESQFFGIRVNFLGFAVAAAAFAIFCIFLFVVDS